MDHKTVGIRRILEFPAIFELFKNMIGAPAALRRYINEFVRPFSGAKVLDIGCGSGKIIEYFPDNIEYVGYDLNSRYIAFARKKYKERGSFFCCRVSEAPSHSLAGQFDFVLATSVLHHLYDDEAEKLLNSAYYHLKSGGVLVTFDCVYVPDQSSIVRFIISKDRGQQVRDPEGYTSLINKPFSSVETFILNDMLRHPFTHFIIRATK